jgi:TolB-like protein/Tfp pilus assembly protein PilF
VGKFRRVARPTEIRSIAVLPFTDLSPAKDQQYFCDGVTEEITDALMRAEGLRVIGPQSAFQLRDKVHDFKSIQRQLNVAAAVHGSVRRAASRIRITAQLIDLSDGSLLWSETYERDSSDILSVQIGIAREIVDRLAVSLPGWRNAKHAKPRTVNPKAHDLYLWGRHFWNLRTEEGIKKAIEYLEKAVAEDPAYGEAWSGLADSYMIETRYSFVPPGNAVRKARAAAVKALKIDDTLAEAHASLAMIRYWLCDRSGLEEEFRRAIDLNPNYAIARQWYAEYLGSSGRVSEALAESQRALELNPLSVSAWNTSGFVFVFARRYDEAIVRFRRSIELERNSRPTHLGLGLAYMEKGMYPEAIRELRPLGDVPRALEILGSTYARAGRREEARRVIGRLRELSPAWPTSALVAIIYADLGEPKLALEYLQKAAGMPAVVCVWVANTTSFDSLRGDPRYHALLTKMGLEK